MKKLLSLYQRKRVLFLIKKEREKGLYADIKKKGPACIKKNELNSFLKKIGLSYIPLWAKFVTLAC